MPQRYELKCNENKNMREGLGGCRPVIHPVEEFTPHNKDKGVKGIIKPLTPQEQTTQTLDKPKGKQLNQQQVLNQMEINLQNSFPYNNQYGLLHQSGDEDKEAPWFTTAKRSVGSNVENANVGDYFEFNDLTPMEIEAAKMTKASYINLREGDLAAREYIKNNLEGWELDPRFTTEHTATFVKGGKVRVSYRGTQTAADWKTNLKLGLGIEESAEQIKAIDHTLRDIIDEFGNENIEFLAGHSKGGGSAIYMGNKYGIDTITQNPALTPKMIANTNPEATHIITRTPTDVVSALTPSAASLKDTIIQKLVPAPSDGILASHDLDLMTGDDHTLPPRVQGDTKYDPNAKNKAYIVKNKDLTFEEIAANSGITKGNPEYLELQKMHSSITPAEHTQILKDAGYSPDAKNSIQNVKEIITGEVVNQIENKTGKLAKKAALLTNKQFLKENAAMIGATFVAGQLAEQITSNHEAQKGLTAATTAGIVKVGNKVGLMSTAGAELFLPLYASIQASEATQQFVQDMPGFKNDPTGLSTAAVAGGVGGLAFAGAGVVQAAATTLFAGAATTTIAGLELGGTVVVAAAEGVELTSLAAGTGFAVEAWAVAETAGEVAAVAPTPVGKVLAGAVAVGALTAVAIKGAIDLFDHKKEGKQRNFYILKPFSRGTPDKIIGRDPIIIAIMNDFNQRQDYSGRELGEVRHAIDRRVHAMIKNGELATYNYYPDIVKTVINDTDELLKDDYKPFGDKNGYMPDADYSHIEEAEKQENEKRIRRETREALENKLVQYAAMGKDMSLDADQEELIKGNPAFYKAYMNYTEKVSAEEPEESVWRDEPHPKTAHTHTQTPAATYSINDIREPQTLDKPTGKQLNQQQVLNQMDVNIKNSFPVDLHNSHYANKL